MPPSDGISVRAILRTRDRLGPRAALALARLRADTLPPGEDRLRLLEVALECAFLAGDEESLLAIARGWSLEEGVRASDEALTLVTELRARGSARTALALARAEVARFERGVALVALAAAAEEAGDLRAAHDALALARASGEPVWAQRALLESLRLGLAHPPLDEELAARAVELVRLPPSELDARDLLLVAAAALRTSSHYDRALALDELVRIARAGAPGPRARALRIGLEHADRVLGRLSPLELERLVVLVSAALPEGDTRAALGRELTARASPAGSTERLALHGADAVRRVRAVLAGGEPGPSPVAREALDEWRALRALAAVHAGRDAEAARMLDAELDEPGPAPAWWAVLVAAAQRPSLANRIEPSARHLAARAVPSLRSLHEIAAHLESRGHQGAALVALRSAVEAGESGARERLVEALLRAGWRAAEAQEPERAISLLREAKERARR